MKSRSIRCLRWRCSTSWISRNSESVRSWSRQIALRSSAEACTNRLPRGSRITVLFGVSTKLSISAALTTAMTWPNSLLAATANRKTSSFPPRVSRSSSNPTISTADTGGIVGLLELLETRGGKEDVFRFAVAANKEFGHEDDFLDVMADHENRRQ